MSVRTRLAVVLAVVVLLPLLAVALLAGVIAPRLQDEAADNRARLAAGALAVEVVGQCQVAGDTATAVAQQARSTDRAQAQAAVDAAVARHAGSFAVVLVRGRPVATAGDAPSASTITSLAGPAERCASARVDRGDPAARQGVVAETVAVTDATGRTVATVVAGRFLDQDWLLQLRASLGLKKGAELALGCTGPGGQVLSTGEGASARQLVEVAAGSRAVGDVTGWRTWRVANVPGLVCPTVAGAQTAGATLTKVALLFAVASLAVGGLLIAWLASSLTRPIVAVTDAAEAVERGDLSVRLPPVTRRDEIGRLASAFNAMTAELDQQVTELHASRDRLRENVSRLGDALQRTHDLDGLLATVLSAAASATGSQRATAWLVEGGGVLARVAHPRGTPWSDRRRLPFGTGLAGDVAADGVPRRLGHGHDDPGTSLNGPALAAPLKRGHSVLGVIVVEREPQGPAYDGDDETMLASLAAPAGIAVDNVLLHREAQRLSVTDPLTGAGNLRHMTTTLAREVERATRFARPLSLLLLDLDHFKSVNDTYGHTVGDAVLRELARRLSTCVREVDTVARYGGEEFVVILPETDIEGAGAVADRICEAVREDTFVVGSDEVPVTVSIGVAALPQHGTASGDLVRAADGALYDAKRAGRDRWTTASGSGEPVAR